MEPIRAGLYSAQQGHAFLLQLWTTIKPWLVAGHRLHIEVRPEKRSDPQNRRMWSMLGEIAAQVTWHGQKLTAEEWKDTLSAALKRQKVVPGIDGGFVVLGQRTSLMSKAEMSELQELMAAFGAQHGVSFAIEDESVIAKSK